MKITETNLKGCMVIEPPVFKDARGSFIVTHVRDLFSEHEFNKVTFLQDNQSISKKHVLRGLHFQSGNYAQAKLVRVVRGSVLDVVVDCRLGSPTYGEHFKILLSDENNKQLFVPRGFAHGFLSLEDDTIFTYKCDNYYNKESEGGIIYNDSDLGIDWGVDEKNLIVSEKDLLLPNFKDIDKNLW